MIVFVSLSFLRVLYIFLSKLRSKSGRFLDEGIFIISLPSNKTQFNESLRFILKDAKKHAELEAASYKYSLSPLQEHEGLFQRYRREHRRHS